MPRVESVTSAFLLAAIACAAASPSQPFYDRVHPSKLFNGPRHYRIFLPPDYGKSGKRYPVIYYFHGHSDRYTLEKYDNGKDTVPKIAGFVASHPVIVVAVDGYVARNYTGFYGGSPWDIQQKEVEYDFGEYFKEVLGYIDTHYRTLTDRRHRATSGLSMGGFMSLWLSARYPDLIGSASSFNPGPEFFVGEQDQRVLWRPKDHISNHEQVMVRLIRASGDYISQYTEETHLAYARAAGVSFEYRQDEYNRHWATSIAETFEFHLRAFSNSALDNTPVEWSHSDPYTHFRVWGFEVTSTGPNTGLTYLEDVTQSGMRITTRQWAPDGPPASRRITVTTAPLYEPGAQYVVTDRSLLSDQVQTENIRANRDGCLAISVDGLGHQIGIAGPGTIVLRPVLLPVSNSGALRVAPGKLVHLPLRVYNPRTSAMKNVAISVSTSYATVELQNHESGIPVLAPAAAVEPELTAVFVAGAGNYAPARFSVTINCDGCTPQTHEVDVLIAPSSIPRPAAIEILDARTITLPVFRQKGNQGGGSSIQRTLSEGRGNGNGVLEPGEEATIWVKLEQGLDPFDKGNWYRAKIYYDSPWLTEVEDLEEQKQLEWTSAKSRTSVVRLSAATPPGTIIPVVLDNESWSFWWTPDVRYGPEPLYQAFQLHEHHLHRYDITVSCPLK